MIAKFKFDRLGRVLSLSAPYLASALQTLPISRARTDIEPARRPQLERLLSGWICRPRYAKAVRSMHGDPASTGGKRFPAGTFYDPQWNTPFLQIPSISASSITTWGASVIGGGHTRFANWQGGLPFRIRHRGARAGYMKVAATALSPYSNSCQHKTTPSPRQGSADWYAFGLRNGFGLRMGIGVPGVPQGRRWASPTSTRRLSIHVALPLGSPRLLTATGSSHQPFLGCRNRRRIRPSPTIGASRGEFLNLGMYKRFEVCGPGGGTVAGLDILWNARH